jgi:glycosyltransferase involved in cell wall biosynthesis
VSLWLLSTAMGRKQKILYVTPFAEMGGAEAVLLNIVRYHDRSRFEPVVAFLRNGPLVERVRQMGFESVVVSTGRMRDIGRTVRAVASLRELIRSREIDLVHSSMAWAHTFGGMAARLAGVPAVWYQHAMPANQSLLDRLASRIPAHSIYVNSRATEEAQRRLYNAADSVRLIYCGLDLSRWLPDSVIGVALRGEFAIPEQSPLIVMPARLQRWKGQHIFIEAAARVLEKLPDTYFLIVGDTLFSIEPEYSKELRAQVARLGLDKRVLFAGMREDMNAIYSAADLVVHASIEPEPFGLTVAEAMAMQRPVVASDSGGPREIVVSGETGFLVPAGDPIVLASKIIDLISDSDLRSRMGRAGYERVRNNFSVERMIAELEADYERILTTKTQRQKDL